MILRIIVGLEQFIRKPKVLYGIILIRRVVGVTSRLWEVGMDIFENNFFGVSKGLSFIIIIFNVRFPRHFSFSCLSRVFLFSQFWKYFLFWILLDFVNTFLHFWDWIRRYFVLKTRAIFVEENLKYLLFCLSTSFLPCFFNKLN